MYKGKSVAVVITAYNEEGFVGDVIRTLPAFVDRAYAVDDASTDGTWQEILHHAGATDGDGRTTAASGLAPEDEPPVVPIRHEDNRGVGAAVKTGYRHALEDGMDVVAVMDGDGQMDPAILDRIVDPVVEGRADYAKGNRLFSRDHVRGMSRWRRFGNAVLTGLTKAASGYWKTMDPQNGYTAISRRALAALEIDELYDDYGFLNDLLVKLNARRLRVADVEMEAVYGDERSSITYSTFVPSVLALLTRGFLWRLKVRYLIYDFHPLVLLYVLGAVGAVGLLGETLLVAVGGLSLAGAVVDGLLLALFSGVALSLAMAFDVMNNEHLETQELEGEGAQYRRYDRPAVVSLSDQHE
jgi:glycosyltransferase involved in cell wall biosynthesis